MRAAPLVLLACAKLVPPGAARVTDASAPPSMVVDARRDGELWIAVAVEAGASLDPVGREGTAALVALASAADGVGVAVDRDRVWFARACPADGASFCASSVVEGLVNPDLSEGQLAALTRGALQTGESERLLLEGRLFEVFDAVVFEGHPYGRPAWGHASVLPLLSVGELSAFHHQRYARRTVSAALVGPWPDDAISATREALAALPAVVQPEPSLFGPSSTRKTKVALVSGPGADVGEEGAEGVVWLVGGSPGVSRADPGWAAARIALSALGEPDAGVVQVSPEFPGLDRALSLGGAGALPPPLLPADAGGGRRTSAWYVRFYPPDATPAAAVRSLDGLFSWMSRDVDAVAFEAARAREIAAFDELLRDPLRASLLSADDGLDGATTAERRAALAAATVDDGRAFLTRLRAPEAGLVVGVTDRPSALRDALLTQWSADNAAAPLRLNAAAVSIVDPSDLAR